MNKQIVIQKAKKILEEFYSDILKGRPITDDELIEEVKNLIRKREDAPFLENFSFYSKMDWSEWELIIAK